MFWLTKNKLKKALEVNKLIHDAIVMGISDKYIEEEKLQKNDFGLLLLGRALNWAIPDLNYNFENDIENVEDVEFKKQFKENNDQIFYKGMAIVNQDSNLEKLIIFYITYEIYLVNNLFPKNNEEKYPGLTRMKKFLFQSLEKEPEVNSPDFKENYKNLFIKFNNEYGKYGKILKKETIDSLFSFL